MNTSPDNWTDLYDSIPTILRWALTVLSLGLLALTRYVWKRQIERITLIEENYVKQKDFDYVRNKVDDIHKHLLQEKNNV